MLRRQVPPEWQVTVDAQLVKVPTGWLRSGLELAEKNPKATAPSMNRLLIRLEADATRGPGACRGTRGPGRLRLGKTAAILARPEFRQVHGPTWLDCMWERCATWLTALLSGSS